MKNKSKRNTNKHEKYTYVNVYVYEFIAKDKYGFLLCTQNINKYKQISLYLFEKIKIRINVS